MRIGLWAKGRDETPCKPTSFWGCRSRRLAHMHEEKRTPQDEWPWPRVPLVATPTPPAATELCCGTLSQTYFVGVCVGYCSLPVFSRPGFGHKKALLYHRPLSPKAARACYKADAFGQENKSSRRACLEPKITKLVNVCFQNSRALHQPWYTSLAAAI